jgi:probable HAF family extracellular repeat protein
MSYVRKATQAAGVAVFLSWSAIAQAALPVYSIEVLGTIPSNTTTGLRIADGGQIAGYFSTQFQYTQAYLWENGSATALPSLGYDAWALGINAQGQVVGSAPNGNTQNQALLWNKGTATILPPLAPAGSTATANAVNSTGQVVGVSYVPASYGYPSFEKHPVLWTNGSVVDLGGGGEALDINDHGLIVGSSSVAMSWQDGSYTILGSLGGYGTVSSALAVNNHGQIVGYSCMTYYACQLRERATLWQDGEIIDLAALAPDGPSKATDINDAGQVVGYSALGSFLWTKESGMVALNSLLASDDPFAIRGMTVGALSINNSGQIAAIGRLDNQEYVLRLTPTAAIPEPSSVLLTAIGLAATVARRRTRRAHG